MALIRPMTNREKAILTVTVLLLVGLAVYYGFLGSFIDDYKQTSDDIDRAREKLETRQQLLDRGEAIDADFRRIEATLPKSKQNRSPQSLFTSEIVSFCGSPPPSLDPHTVEPVLEAREFAYLTINVSRLQGSLDRIVKVLTEIHKRNLLVEDLQINPVRAVKNPTLRLTVKIAQLVRVADLDAFDRKNIEKKLEAAGSGSSSRRYKPL